MMETTGVFEQRGNRITLAPMLKPDRQQEAIPSSMKTEEGGSREVRSRLSTPLIYLTLSCVWLWCRMGDVLTLSQPLGYSSKEEMAHRLLNKIQCGEDSN